MRSRNKGKGRANARASVNAVGGEEGNTEVMMDGEVSVTVVESGDTINMGPKNISSPEQPWELTEEYKARKLKLE